MQVGIDTWGERLRDCGHIRVTINDVIWALIMGAALIGAFIGVAWLLGALFLALKGLSRWPCGL
jgi:hypothetical protein